MSIRDRIEKILAEKNMTKAELADTAGIKRMTIYSCFQRNTELQLSTLRPIAKVLDVSLDYLIYGKEKEQKQSNIQTLYNLLNEPNRIALEAYAEGMAMAQYGADLSTLKERYDRED